MFNKIFTILFVALLVASITQAADDQKNIVGYDKTLWGMTPYEVLKAEAPRAEILEKPEGFIDGIGIITIKEIEIVSSKFSVIFIFDKAKQKLMQVNLTSFEKENDRINSRSFSSVEHLLTEKYGTPTYKKGNSVVSWKLPKTSIELSHLNIPGIISQVTVRYTPSTRSEKDARDL